MTKYIYYCACHSKDHYLLIDRDFIESKICFSIQFDEMSFIERLKRAIKIIFGKRTYQDDIIFDKKQLMKLSDDLEDWTKQKTRVVTKFRLEVIKEMSSDSESSTNDMSIVYAIKCNKCNSLMIPSNAVYLSYPPQYKYKCANCDYEVIES